ncbi:TPA: DUF2283 domain-containing protein [Candidatus Woesearchaeota archaeon]|nr:DUF2283 domain-containing protein [Candidatus Woesearchaeota archaeon]HII69415.1 DUF2283 domain-containing protein [Candidatus Woesearchaeota archaeon]
MKIEYQQEHDIMSILFLEGAVIDDSIEDEGIIFDYDKEKRLVAVEILDARKRIGKNPMDKVDFSIVRNIVVAS